MNPEPRTLILTGLSGAGKTTAIQALEDLGFFAVDNLPPGLWLELVNEARSRGEDRIVIAIDSRTERFLEDVQAGLSALEAGGFEPQVVFLTADEASLIRRYSFTRRAHPLAEGTLSSDIRRENAALLPLQDRASVVIDTTDLSAAQLRATLSRRYGGGDTFRLQLVSFGFKRGSPRDADMVLDVRSMPNPYYDPELRALPGTEANVASYVLDSGGQAVFDEIRDFVRSMTRLALGSGRAQYTIAIGCTGGQHRSVAVSERLKRELSTEFLVQVEHRHLQEALQEHTK